MQTEISFTFKVR